MIHFFAHKSNLRKMNQAPENNPNSFNLLYTNTINRNDDVLYHFTDSAEAAAWMTDMRRIKNEIQLINEDWGPELYPIWLEHVNQNLRQKWGDGKVPPDIRRAVVDVQAGLGLPLTDWN